MNFAIPVLATAAATAVAIYAFNKFTSERVLEEQYNQIRDAATKLSGSSKQPVTIAVLGLQNHGKSSFINTVHRVLYREKGPLIIRAETAPTKNTTKLSKVHRIKNKLMRHPKHLMDIIDTPGFPEADLINESTVAHTLKAPYSAENQSLLDTVDCVILLMKAKESPTAVERMQQLSKIIRDKGLQFVIAITYKKEAKKSTVNLQELTETIAEKTGTDLVHCIDNYVADHQDGKNGIHVRNTFETHSQTLNIMRQCFEFVKQRRQAFPPTGDKNPGTAESATGDISE